MSRKLTALFMSILMIPSIFACGADEGSTDTTPSVSETTEAPVDDSPLASGVPAGTTFDGAVIRFLNGAYYDKYHYTLSASEIIGDTVNDAVYNRNRVVESRLGVTFEFKDVLENYANDYVLTNTLRRNINSGDQEYDIFQGIQAYSKTHALEGLITDISDSEYITFDAPWWSGQWMDKAHLGTDKRYMVTGDISALHTMNLTVTFCNKKLLDDYYGDSELIYQDVLGGKWTFDRLYELSNGIWDDVNGNNKRDIEDTLGYVQSTQSSIINVMFLDAGGRTTVSDENGEIQVVGMDNREVSIVEKLYRITWENAGFFDPGDEGIYSETELPLEFAKGGILFVSNFLFTSDLLRDMENDYAIIPNPKLSEEDDYISIIHDQTPVYSIPSVTSTEEMACAVLEEMAYEGYMNMIPQYYEVALKNKYMRDNQDDSMKIIDMIKDSATSDPGRIMGLTMYAAAAACIKEGSTNYASNHASRYEASVTKLQEFKDFYFG